MRKVFCIGELLIDFVAENQGNDLSKAVEFTKKAGGAPANVACAIARLGVQSSFIGSLGKDPFGDFLLEKLRSEGVETKLVQRSEVFTTLAFVSIAEDGERDFVFSRGADRELQYDPSVKANFKGNMIHLGAATALLGGSLEKAYGRYFFDGLTQGSFISFDPNFRGDLWKNNEAAFVRKCLPFIEKSNLCKFSKEEAMLLSGKDSLEEAADFLHGVGTPLILVTLGAEGTLVSTPTTKNIIESIPVKVVDTTGAGDAFIGCVLSEIAKKGEMAYQDEKTLHQIIAYANKAGAITTTGFGAIESLPDTDQLQSYG